MHEDHRRDLGTPCAARYLLDHAVPGELGPVARAGCAPGEWVAGRWWVARASFLRTTAESIVTRHLVDDIAERRHSRRHHSADAHFARVGRARVCLAAAPFVDSTGSVGFACPVTREDAFGPVWAWVQLAAARMFDLCSHVEVGHMGDRGIPVVRGWFDGDPAFLVRPMWLDADELEDMRTEIEIAAEAALHPQAARAGGPLRDDTQEP